VAEEISYPQKGLVYPVTATSALITLISVSVSGYAGRFPIGYLITKV
jgi:hypothetical protein